MLASTQLRFHDVEQTPELLGCLRRRLAMVARRISGPVECTVVIEPEQVFVEIRRQRLYLSVTREVNDERLVDRVNAAFDGLQSALRRDQGDNTRYRPGTGVTGS